MLKKSEKLKALGSNYLLFISKMMVVSRVLMSEDTITIKTNKS